MATKSGPGDRKTKTSNIEHPYKDFETTHLWDVVDTAIDDLVENTDIQETTHRNYIVGYLCKKLAESNLIKEE